MYDDHSDLWGYGYNRYGQLGNGQADEMFTESPLKIASDVVSVDSSCNGYFCIYLTSEGELYGMGADMLGLLGQDSDKQIHYMAEDSIPVVKPVILLRKRLLIGKRGKMPVIRIECCSAVRGRYWMTAFTRQQVTGMERRLTARAVYTCGA